MHYETVILGGGITGLSGGCGEERIITEKPLACDCIDISEFLKRSEI